MTSPFKTVQQMLAERPRRRVYRRPKLTFSERLAYYGVPKITPSSSEETINEPNVASVGSLLNDMILQTPSPSKEDILQPSVIIEEKELCEIDANEGTTESAADEKPHVPERARIVFNKQHFCVSYFSNGKEYILHDSDGLNKTPIYISFTEKKPLVGKAAMKVYKDQPTFVVFDLIKLCSVTNADIESPKWGFTVSKENDSFMVVWETPGGKQKQAVEFLLALIIKNAKDRIKKKYGKRMTEIEIGFDGFAPNEILKKNFIEAGNLLKINIIFV